MVQNIRALGLLALGLASLAVAVRAEDAGRLFDRGASLNIPALKSPAILAAAAADAPAEQTNAQRSNADLYYFTPEEAAAAKDIFGVRDQSGDAPGFVFDDDVPDEIQAQVRGDLAFIDGIRGEATSPLHRKIFGAMSGLAYTKFFNSRVTGIGLSTCGSPIAVACVMPFFDPSKMWLTQNYIKFSHPQVARMMVVFHEARHTETQNGNWSHATCPTPFKDANGNDVKSIWTGASLAGEPACDKTPFGSYGSSTIMLKNIQKFCANCTDKVRMDAGLYADDQFGRIIDEGARKQMQNDLSAPASPGE